MTFHTHHTLAGGELQELILQVLIFRLQDEGDVHERTAVLLSSADEEFVAVDFGIHDFGALLGQLLHGLHTAVSLHVAEVHQGRVDRHHWRRVEHRTLLHVSAVVEHRGDVTRHLAECVFLHDDEGETSHGEVLLRTTIDEGILAHIDRTAEDVGRHVGNQRNWRVEVFAQFCTINGVVRSDVQIVCICWNLKVAWDVSEVLVGRRSHFHHLTECLGLLLCLGSPNTRVQVGSLLLQEVVGNHAEFKACTAAEEEHGVALRNVEKFLEESNCLVNYWLKILSAVANLHERES